MYAVKIEHNLHVIAKVLAEAISLNSSRLLRLARTKSRNDNYFLSIEKSSIHFKTLPNFLLCETCSLQSCIFLIEAIGYSTFRKFLTLRKFG